MACSTTSSPACVPPGTAPPPDPARRRRCRSPPPCCAPPTGPTPSSRWSCPAHGPTRCWCGSSAPACATPTSSRVVTGSIVPATDHHRARGSRRRGGRRRPTSTTIAVGDHVVLSFDSCGACARCLAGQPASCETFLLRNLLGRRADLTDRCHRREREPRSASRWFGAVVVRHPRPGHGAQRRRRRPRTSRSRQLGPLGCGIQTGAGTVLVALDVQPGTSLVVFGAGAVGLAAVMAAESSPGRDTIVAVDLHAHRLDLARELGATHAVDGSTEDVARPARGGHRRGCRTTPSTPPGVPAVMLDALGVPADGRLLRVRRRADGTAHARRPLARRQDRRSVSWRAAPTRRRSSRA